MIAANTFSQWISACVTATPVTTAAWYFSQYDYSVNDCHKRWHLYSSKRVISKCKAIPQLEISKEEQIQPKKKVNDSI